MYPEGFLVINVPGRIFGNQCTWEYTSRCSALPGAMRRARAEHRTEESYIQPAPRVLDLSEPLEWPYSLIRTKRANFGAKSSKLKLML